MKMQFLEAIMALGLMQEPEVRHLDPNEVACLTEVVYREARGETKLGQRAVAHVALNRVDAAKFPSSICAVVEQPGQFPWAKRRQPIREPAALENAYAVAVNAMTGASSDPTNGATYFYAHRAVTPGWSRKFTTTRRIGAHTFQKERSRGTNG